ncbi:hypothetical protein H2199_000292 [Coniosporium tulheliwenetii]|uniref:Uncharacterized protein n=1 Tax=Coniosporium tulheliwenetii TaxID=3383036 RepID=A0ACC2ZPH5_9PEZI|nr:hypothetical protein H2199_000292 [Cladosporium sp. JES 115]
MARPVRRAAAQAAENITEEAKGPSKAAKPTAAKTNTTKKLAAREAPTKANGATEAPRRGRPRKMPEADAEPKATKATAAAVKAEPKKPGRKRKAETPDEEPTEDESKPTKRKRTASPAARPIKKAKAAAKPAKVTPKNIINSAPTQRLHIFVFGEGSSGELGLGTSKKAIDVKRPRLNPNLDAQKVGVVQIATGACTEMKEDGDDSDSDSDAGSETDMNPHEATPAAIPSTAFPEDVRFVQVVAGDSTSFALTDDGFVWGWGTFRSNEGIFGFTKDILIQRTPALVEGVKNITSLACGANHILALDNKGNVFAWGSGQQNQLGRRIVERNKHLGLIPTRAVKNIKYIACGDYHSFAIDNKNRVLAWGANNFGETGITQGAGESNAVIISTEPVTELSGKGFKMLKGGAHHSVGVTEDGDCLVWGRLDGYQTGLKINELPEESVISHNGRRRILKVPTKVPGFKAQMATCGTDHTIAITTDGKAYSWGFSANYQTGQGTDDDVEVATLIDNTAVRGKKLVYAGAGGQYSVLAALADEDTEMVNGVGH